MAGSQLFNGYGCLPPDSQLFAACAANFFGVDASGFGFCKDRFRVTCGDELAGLILTKQPAV